MNIFNYLKMTIKKLIKNYRHITSFVKKREMNVGILAGLQEKSTYIAYNSEKININDNFKINNPDIKIIIRDEAFPEKIDNTEILFIDTEKEIGRVLRRYSPFVEKRIVIWGTQPYGKHELANDEEGAPLSVLRKFMEENLEWSVIYHSVEQNGLTIISKDKKDKPKKPGLIRLASNFRTAMAEYAKDGFKNVEKNEYQERLEICTMCQQRDDDRCAVCGCFIKPKSLIKSSECPLNKWPKPSS